ncbi:FABP family protein [Flaviflexus equikiangi]|uniref:FABP family protein n=1 Tax=Flaviflexus equikiangi TaxID=2758573 RepID=A0ABS2TG93_9ACTO|nr:FABP family protein [Flaviflexus equikiangi]MBM9433660.1 FABP family protein [Flaviflexus equikiangi]
MFEIPDNLAPETYPMAWLVGTWRGYGMLGYPGIDDAAIICDLEIHNDGGPYLTVTSTWTLANENPDDIDKELPGSVGVSQLTENRRWQVASGYLRQSPEKEGDVEAMIATPDGRVALYIGTVKAPRMTLISDAMVRSATGAEVNASSLQVGLVESDLLFAYDMAAFGEEMQSYAAGRLSRVREDM